MVVATMVAVVLLVAPASAVPQSLQEAQQKPQPGHRREDPTRFSKSAILLVPAIVVAAAPAMTTLGPKEAQQLAAAVTSMSNPTVAWSFNPPVRSISPPASCSAAPYISALQIVTADPTSVAAPSKSENAVRAQTYYVATTGSDKVTCTRAKRISTPKRTIAAAARCLAPGDTLQIRGGTYVETLDDVVPSGTSWQAPVTVGAYKDERVTLAPEGSSFVFQSTKGSYIVLDRLIFDGSKVRYDAVEVTYGPGAAYAHHIRITNSEVKNAPHSGIAIHQGDLSHRTDHNELINLKIHDNGTTDLHHGLYIDSSYNVLDALNVYNNSGWGVQVYTGRADGIVDGNVIRNSIFHDNARSGRRGVGIGLYNGSGNVAYNNLVYNNSGGIALNYGLSGARVVNNTVYNNNRGQNHWGIYNGNDEDRGRVGSVKAQLWNNIVYKNDRDLVSHRTDAIVATNLLGKDPMFVNPSVFDFALRPGSPAIDAGTNARSLLETDIRGTARPRGAGYDIGAYECQ